MYIYIYIYILIYICVYIYIYTYIHIYIYALPKIISKHKCHCIGCDSKRCFLGLLFLSFRIPADHGTIPGDFDRRAEMSVRVRKGGFMVETL